MLHWFATKLLPKKLRKHFISSTVSKKPSLDATGNYSAAFELHAAAEQPGTPGLTPTGQPDIASTFRHASASAATPHATPGPPNPNNRNEDAAPSFAFRHCAADAKLSTPEAACTSRPAPSLTSTAPLHASVSGRQTPLATLSGAPDPTPDVARTKRYLVADGRTMGYANTFRKNAENRPLQLHETPFEHQIEKELALEMRAAQAALEAAQQRSPKMVSIDPAAQPGLLAGGDGGVVVHTPQLRTLRQMR